MKAKHKNEMRRLHSRLAKYGMPVRNIASRSLRLQQREEFRLLYGHQSKIRRKRKLTFEQWLRAQGMEEQAECWRQRVIFEELAPTMKKTVSSRFSKVNFLEDASIPADIENLPYNIENVGRHRLPMR